MPVTAGAVAKATTGKTKSAAGQNGASARTRAGRRLVIVESPAKARTIAGYLGQGYVVESSIGHIRDMPDKAAEIPVKYRKEPWARLGVNVDEGFEALYVVHADKKQQVSKLKQLLAGADELLLATDEDREGEAIAWHLLQELKPKVPTSRMVFHEITPEAIAQAVANPRELDQGTRPGGCWTGCMATRSRRSCGRRSCPGCRQAGSSRSQPGSSSSGNASGWRSARPGTGTSKRFSPRPTRHPRLTRMFHFPPG